MPAPRTGSLVALLAVLGCGGGGTAASAGGAPGAPAPASQALPATPCSGTPGSFCWLNPLPQGSSLVGLWVAGPGEAWAAGPVGALVRWDGQALATVPVSAAALRAVWGAAPDDGWAAGDGVLHFDGRAWSPAAAPPGAWNAVHGSSPRDVWLVGDAGAAAHFDGARWAAVPTGTGDDLVAVAVAPSGEAFAAARRGGAVLRWDGAAWVGAGRAPVRSASALFTDGAETWLAGEADSPRAVSPLFRRAGDAWVAVAVPGLEGGRATALAGDAPGQLWVAATGGAGAQIARLDADTWTVEALPAGALPTLALAPATGGVLAVGEGGQAFLRGPAGWAAAHRGAPSAYLQAAATSPAGDAWFGTVLPGGAGDGAALLHLRDGHLEAVPVGISDAVYGLFALAPDDVWAGSLANGFLHFDGRRWTARVAGQAGLVDGVWASAKDDVWGVSGGAALRFDGRRVTRLPFPRGAARHLFGLSSADLWAFGAANVVQHWDGTAWTALDVPGLLHGAWGSAPDDVWFVGEGGLALHWDGRGFTRVETGTAATLRAIRGAGPRDLWVAGAGGTILHGDGTSFRPVPSGTPNALGAVAVTAAGDVYVAGDYGTILARAR